MAQTVSQPTVY